MEARCIESLGELLPNTGAGLQGENFGFGFRTKRLVALLAVEFVEGLGVERRSYRQAESLHARAPGRRRKRNGAVSAEGGGRV